MKSIICLFLFISNSYSYSGDVCYERYMDCGGESCYDEYFECKKDDRDSSYITPPYIEQEAEITETPSDEEFDDL